MILVFMTTKYFVLTTFSTPISLWFSLNSKLNIWCSTWLVNKVEGAKMRLLMMSLLFSLFDQNEHKSRYSFRIDHVCQKKIFLMMVQIKETFYRNEVLFLQSVITSEWLLWVLWSSFLLKDSFSWACSKGHLDYFHDWGKSLPCWIDSGTN